MPVLAAWIGSLFTALGAFLTKLFLARLALRIAGIAALVTAMGILMTTYNGLVAPLVAAAFTSNYGQVLGLAFPPVAGTCIAAIAGVWSACGLYSLNRRAIAATSGV